MGDSITASDWAKGIGYSIVASIIGGASKLAIRKSWLIVRGSQDSSEEWDGSSNDEQSSSSYLDINTQTLQTEDTHASVSRRTHHVAIVLRGSGMIGMTFLNPLFCVLAMNYASPSILAPFSGLTLVWIVLFSEMMIQEAPQRTQVIAAMLIILGQVVVAIFGDHTNDENVSLDDLEKSYQDPYFQLYFFLMALWMASLATMIITNGPTPTMCRFAWGVSGGSVTGFQNFLKDTLTIKKAVDTYNDQNGGDDDASAYFEPLSYPWYFPLMILLAMATAFGGLLLLTACMKRYDATFSSSMFVGSFVISASIMSAVHYQTFQHLESSMNWILYPTGLIILMVGVWILVNETKEQHEGESLQRRPLVSDDEQTSYADDSSI